MIAFIITKVRKSWPCGKFKKAGLEFLTVAFSVSD